MKYDVIFKFLLFVFSRLTINYIDITEFNQDLVYVCVHAYVCLLQYYHMRYYHSAI